MISLFLIGYQSYTTTKTLDDLANNFRTGSHLPMRKGFNALLAGQKQWQMANGIASSLEPSVTNFAFQQAGDLDHSMKTLSDAIDVSAKIGLAIALAIVLYAWVIAAGVFRVEVLNLRRTGRVSQNLIILMPSLYAKGVVPRDVYSPNELYSFIGLSGANTYVSLILLTYIFTFVLSLFVWDTSRLLMWDLIVRYKIRILLMLVTPLVVMVLRRWGAALSLTPSQRHIKDNRLFQLINLILMLLNIISGFAGVLLRIGLAFVGNILSLASVVHITTPVWMYTTGSYALFGAFRDKMARSFAVLVRMYADNNNPTAHVFMWLLLSSRSENGSVENGSVENGARSDSASSRRIKNRWRLAVMLLRNPSLQAYRSHQIVDVLGDDEGECLEIETKDSSRKESYSVVVATDGSVTGLSNTITVSSV